MKKIDRIIQIIREEMMTANAPGAQGGGGSQTDPKGTKGLTGFDPVVKFMRRGKIDYRKVKPTYKKWVKKLENK